MGGTWGPVLVLVAGCSVGHQQTADNCLLLSLSTRAQNELPCSRLTKRRPGVAENTMLTSDAGYLTPLAMLGVAIRGRKVQARRHILDLGAFQAVSCMETVRYSIWAEGLF